MSLKDILNPEPKSPRSPSRPETGDPSLEPPSDVYMTDATTSRHAMSPAQELSRASPPLQQTLQPSNHPTTKVSEGVHQSEGKFQEEKEVPLASLTSTKEPTGKAEALLSAPEARPKVNQSMVTDSATITSDATEETNLVKSLSPLNEDSTPLPSHRPSDSETVLDPKTTTTADEKSSSSRPNKQDSATTDQMIATTKGTSDPTERTTPSVDVKPEMPPPSPTIISPTSSVPPRLSELSPNADNVDGSVDKSSPPPPQGRAPGAAAKPGKKRKLPPKKGTASLKKAPANKRLKRDSEDYSAESTRSNTPVSVLKSAASKNSTPKPVGKPKRGGRRSSHAPSDLSTSPAVAAEEEEDGLEVYCICRKPDNHEWMIGCDWGCDDWFHGTCVGFNKELAPLVDMYCCPNCAGLGRGPTTWRRKCQYEPCNNPASKPSSSDPEGSKFCSPEHGVQFFKDKAQTLLDGKKGKDGASGLGGTLTKSQLKALAEGVGSAEEFKALGDIGESDEMDVDKREDAEAAPDGNGESGEEYTAERLKAIAQQLDEMEASFALLTDKDTLINAVRDQYKSLHASGSRICGYHTLLSSSPAEFEAFRLSPAGQDLFAAPPAPPNTPADPSEPSPESSTPTEIGHGVIAKGRLDGFEEGLCRKGASCSQHRDWWRIAKEDVADAKRSCQERRRELQKEREECGVRIRMESLEGGNRGEGIVEALED